jgi:hypothetical protein
MFIEYSNLKHGVDISTISCFDVPTQSIINQSQMGNDDNAMKLERRRLDMIPIKCLFIITCNHTRYSIVIKGGNIVL